MDELDGLFDILVRLTQDVDVHLVKRALQITQILFRKLSPPRQHANDGNDTEDDTPERFKRRCVLHDKDAGAYGGDIGELCRRRR